MSRILDRLIKKKQYKVEILVYDNLNRPIYKMEVRGEGKGKAQAMKVAEKALRIKANKAWLIKQEKKK